MAEGPSKSEDGNSFWIEDGEPGRRKFTKQNRFDTAQAVGADDQG